jgi:hypothetical protein
MRIARIEQIITTYPPAKRERKGDRYVERHEDHLQRVNHRITEVNRTAEAVTAVEHETTHWQEEYGGEITYAHLTRLTIIA